MFAGYNLTNNTIKTDHCVKQKSITNDLHVCNGRRTERSSLQSKRKFLRLLGEQRRKRGEREARARREARKNIHFVLLPSRATRVSRSPHFHICSPKMRKNLHLFQSSVD